MWRDGTDADSRLHLLGDWATWLTLSSTPDYTSSSQPLELLELQCGHPVNVDAWPSQIAPRVYVAFDETEAVYVGQTSQPLAQRIRRHFGARSTPDQRRKASTWRYVVSVAFTDLAHGELDQLEASAADWVLPLRRRAGRRHPRPR